MMLYLNLKRSGMKKGWIYALTMGLLLVACDDSDEDNMKNSDAKVAEVENVAKNGQWRITYFSDSDTEETDNFTGYIFEFDGSNHVTASDGANNYMGTWSVIDDDS